MKRQLQAEDDPAYAVGRLRVSRDEEYDSPSSSSSQDDDKSRKSCFAPTVCAPGSFAPSREVAAATTEYLSADMERLTLAERTKLHSDMLGETPVIEETPQLLAECLEKLEVEVRLIRKRHAYDRVAFLCPSYVRDRKFRIMFLRAEEFRPASAARRLVRHFEKKLHLFGPDKIHRDIVWDDLDEDDRAACLSGTTQVFSNVTDKFGRVIFNQVFVLRKHKHLNNQLRSLWWMFNRAIKQSEESQQKGVVSTGFAYGMSAADFYKVVVELFKSRTEKCLPARLAVAHFCFLNDSFLRPLFSATSGPVDPNTRVRFRAHFGSHLECQYSLASCGIPAESLPLDDSGTLRDDWFKSLIQSTRDQEQTSGRGEAIPPNRIVCPTNRDILLGRGAPFQNFAGNRDLATIIKYNVDRYENDSKNRKEKTNLSMDIVLHIQAMGGRFLQRDESDLYWVVVPDEKAREKVSMGFRNQSRKN